MGASVPSVDMQERGGAIGTHVVLMPVHFAMHVACVSVVNSGVDICLTPFPNSRCAVPLSLHTQLLSAIGSVPYSHWSSQMPQPVCNFAHVCFPHVDFFLRNLEVGDSNSCSALSKSNAVGKVHPRELIARV